MRNEFWQDCFRDQIPRENYEMQLLQGEQQGLVIHLYGSFHHVTLDFGNVQAINILDEGVQLNDPPRVTFVNQAELHRPGFPDTLYQVENGAYAAYLKAYMGTDLYETMNLRQYTLVTLNYVVEIICAAEPIITITNI
jgi:hypothetical protein